MKNKNEWEVSKTKNGFYLLEIKPDIIGEYGAIYKIDNIIYEFAQNKDVDLTILLDTFDILNSCEKITSIKKIVPNINQRINTPTKYYGKGFIVTKENNKYYIMYQLALHGGGNRKFEISKEIYQDAKTGKYSTADIFKKYNLYHLDIPENNVKE